MMCIVSVRNRDCHPELSGCITTLTVRNTEVANFCAAMDTLIAQDEGLLDRYNIRLQLITSASQYTYLKYTLKYMEYVLLILICHRILLIGEPNWLITAPCA